MIMLSIEFCFCLVQRVREFDLGGNLHRKYSVEEEGISRYPKRRKLLGGDTGNQQKIGVSREKRKDEMNRIKLWKEYSGIT